MLAIQSQNMVTDGETSGAADAAALQMYYSQDGAQPSPRRSVGTTNTIMVPPSLLMGQAPRYDEVYYPRTDKRMIRKFLSIFFPYKQYMVIIGGNQYEYEGNDYQK
jgi:hypothetical protein